MPLLLLLLVFFQVKHFIFDFVYQPKWQWANKGTYGHPGGVVHALQHSIPTTMMLCLILPGNYPVILGLLEFMIHYHVDWAKMNINRIKGWKADTHNEFWILLGLDQLLHQLTYVALIWTSLNIIIAT